MSMENVLQYELGELPMDVFQLADRGLRVESLTAGNGMAENKAAASVLCALCFNCAGGGGGGGQCGFCGL
jgi:hypothetical protein